MALVYFETSALLKLILHQGGSRLAGRLWDRADAVLTSRISDVEVRAALAAGERAGLLDGIEHHQAAERWAETWPALRLVEYSPAVAQGAASLTLNQAVRGGDAIHVASAAQFAAANVIMATWDPAVAAAGRANGLTVVPR